MTIQKVIIDPGFPGQVHVAADGTITISGPDSGGTAGAAAIPTPFNFPGSDLVLDRIKRMEDRYGAGTAPRPFAEWMLNEGWTAKATGRYVRWTYKGKAHKVTLYQKSFSVGTSEHRPFMESLPKVEVRKNDVHLSVRPADLDETLSTIESIRAWADGAKVT